MHCQESHGERNCQGTQGCGHSTGNLSAVASRAFDRERSYKWRNRPELWMPWARKSWTMIAWRSLLPTTPCSQMGPAQGTPPLWLPKLCRQFQLFCLYLRLLTVLHLLEDMMAPRQKPWGLWSWGQTHAHQEEGQWFGYCHEEASF